MKRYIILLLSFALAAPLFGQNHAEISAIDPLYANELYRSYPEEMITPQTPAPKGYKPFYLSHLGRHGSRWTISKSHYTNPMGVLEAAHRAGELTSLGERFYEDWKVICADAENRCGELSPRGFAEHRGIARRMYNSFPEIFASKKGRPAKVDCRSTTVPRCILSMASFVQELSTHAPNAEIRMESSEANAWYMAAYDNLNSVKSETKPLSDSIRRAYMPDHTPFFNRIFKEGSTVAKSIKNQNDFLYEIFLVSANLACTSHVGIQTHDYIFTEEERAALWRCSNMRRYILTGPSKGYGDALLDGIKPMVRNVIDTAERAIATGDEQATLRFAHDVTIIPYVCFLGIEAGSIRTDDYENVGYHWQCNVVTPMAANVQIIFYRNKHNDILVKVLHNECEQILDKAITPFEGCYYRWEDYKAYLLQKGL